jgi:hypothetical protein
MNSFSPPPHDPAMTAALKRAHETLDAIAKYSPTDVSGDDRPFALAMFTSIACEHFLAILILSQSGRTPGTVLTLFRPLAETIFRGQWLMVCATDLEVSDFLSNPDFHFKGFKQLVDDIDQNQQLHGFYDNFKAAYSVMCDYTHSGHLHATQRFSTQGIGPAYPLEMQVGSVTEAEKMLLVHCIFFCRALGEHEGANALTKLANYF